RRHPALALPNDCENLLLSKAPVDANERRECRGRARTIFSMADCALGSIYGFSEVPGSCIFQQTAGPCHFVGVDVEYSGRRIDRRAAPLSAPIKAGEDHGLFVQAEGNELAAAPECLELLRRPCVSLG